MRISDWSSDVCSSDLGSQTRIQAAHLDGRLAGRAVTGTFSGAGGQIGNVPLILSAAAGDWRFADGKLALTGGLTVADAAEEPRFNPLVSNDVAFDLAANRITATGTLAEPRSEEHTSELQSLMRISYAVFCLKKKKI